MSRSPQFFVGVSQAWFQEQKKFQPRRRNRVRPVYVWVSARSSEASPNIPPQSVMVTDQENHTIALAVTLSTGANPAPDTDEREGAYVQATPKGSGNRSPRTTRSS